MTSRQALLSNYVARLRYSPERIQPHLADLLAENLVRRVRDDFYNPVVLEMATCVLFAIFAATTSKIPINERIRYWFRDLEQIGAESVEGYAMRTDLGLVEDTLILKAPRDPANSDILHELFIGLYGTNRLRSILPNFAYIFGGFSCSAPIIQPRSEVVAGQVVRRDEVEVVSYCETPEKGTLDQTQVPYVIYENIAPAVSLASYVKTCTAEEFFLVFHELILALRRAWLSLGFVHNDLHHENALIRQLTQIYSFPYSTPQGKRFITTDQVATIIDFGRSRIQYQGQSFGFTGLEFVGVFEDMPLPYLDAYKVLFFCLFTMMQENKAAFDRVKPLAAYFYPELNPEAPDFDRRLRRLLTDKRKDVYYPFDLDDNDQVRFRQLYQDHAAGLPITGPQEWVRAVSFDYDDFLVAMSRLCDCSFLTVEPLAPIAYCRNETCGQSFDVLNSFFERPLNQLPTPEDFFELYDLHTNEDATLRFKQDLVNEFRPSYSRARDDYIMSLLGQVNTIRDVVTEIDPNLTLTQLNFRAIVNIAGIYRERFTQIAEAISDWKHLPFMVEIGQYVANLYHDDDLIQQINDLIQQGLPYQLRLAEYVERLVADRAYLLRLLEDETIIGQDANNADLGWLRLVFPEALDVLLE